jgi:uncharacterized protein (TIGR00661 family)
MNPNKSIDRPRILVAPLDWGLGHATRCIPIIRELITNNCEVLLACEGKIELLLRQEFPQLTYVPLKGYNIHYGKTKWELYGKLLLQIPKILEAINKENDWLDEVIDTYAIDGVISDNRYGLYSDKVPAVFITHQLLIKTTMGEKADRFLQKFNYHFIDEYTACWVPDVADEAVNLAGDLSHPVNQPAIPLHYIGPLSRLQRPVAYTSDKHLLILLSGPEPQRSLLEEILVKQLEAYTAPALLVRGLPGQTDINITVPAHVQVVNHLPTSELEQAIAEASYVIARCGYSTVMDLVALQKKSILIPTPGQTEQEYLAAHLIEQGTAFCMMQEHFDLQQALELANEYNYYFPEPETTTSLSNVISAFVLEIISKKEKVQEKLL